jgi:hypothetical protein
VTPLARTSRPVLLAATVVLILVGVGLANFAPENESGDASGFIVSSLVSTLVAAGMFLFVVPRAEEEARRDNGPAMIGLILGAIAALLLVVFWSGLPFALGVPAFALGSLGRDRARELGGEGAAIAAQILGAVAVALALLGCIFRG